MACFPLNPFEVGWANKAQKWGVTQYVLFKWLDLLRADKRHFFFTYILNFKKVFTPSFTFSIKYALVEAVTNVNTLRSMNLWWHWILMAL